MRSSQRNRGTLARALQAALACLIAPAAAWGGSGPTHPVAAAFVYPVGDEMDYTKAALGEGSGFYVSDPYLATRKSRKRGERRHYGVDLSNGRGGHTVRAVAAGVVEISEPNALVKVKKTERVKKPVVVNGKHTYKWTTRKRTVYKWRTGWGNRVVIRHTLPSGEMVYSLYAHLMPRSVTVKKGAMVFAGEPIGRVGRTGRATSPHLHLEIRQTMLDPDSEISGADGDGENPGEQLAEIALLHTIDPIRFLAGRVIRLEDLTPGTWQARYAMAAVKDGVLWVDKHRFEPDDSITRATFYRALVSTFNLGTPFTKGRFGSQVDALIDNGIIDERERPRQAGDDRVTQSEALELVLRCLDRSTGRGGSLARIPDDQLCRDFNRQFAGEQAAREAERQARRLAAAETAKQQKDAAARAARAAKQAKASGKPVRKRAPKVSPVKPVPVLDPGFETLAVSRKSLSRAEACLLLASALRMSPTRLSALERAAAKVAGSG